MRHTDEDLCWDKERPNVFYGMPRDNTALECKCGGYAAREPTTQEERFEFGCGRDQPNNECCARAFVCVLCKARYVGDATAPEMSYDA